jgi:hypothetical protein
MAVTGLTDSLVTVTQGLYDKFVGLRDTLGLTDVFWGDQLLIPRSPCLCIEPGNKSRDMPGGLNRRTTNTFVVYLILYHSEVRSPQSNRKDADTLAEAIEREVHLDATLGGLLTHGYCTRLDSGYATKVQQQYRSARIQFEGNTTTNLPPSP